MHLYIKWQIWFFESPCTIDGSRIEGQASLRTKHDRKNDNAYMCLKTPCHALSILCLLSKLSLQEVSADRQNSVPAGNFLSADYQFNSRWKFWSAGRNSVWPVVLCSVQVTCPRTLAIYREIRQYKQKWQGYGTGFSGEPSSEHASSAHPEAEAVATLCFLLHPFF